MLGSRVKTIRPERESTDWTMLAKMARRWGVVGTVRSKSDSHGVCYEVEHDDGTLAWYEPRELQGLTVALPTPRCEREPETVFDQMFED